MANTTVVNESILGSIKKLLNISNDVEVFDQDIALQINTALANLVQMGVGPEEGYRIESSSDTWGDFMGQASAENNPLLVENLKTYVFIKVKMMFDPPQNSAMIDAMDRQAKEIEYRVYTQKGGF